MYTYIIEQFIEQHVLYTLLSKLNFTSCSHFLDLAVKMYQLFCLRMAL